MAQNQLFEQGKAASGRVASILIAAAAVLGLSGCVKKVPKGFSEGTQWSIPAIGALEDGMFIVPVQLNEQGPFLFQVNPGSRSALNPAIGKQLGLKVEYTRVKAVGAQPSVIREDSGFINIQSLKVGDLSLSGTAFAALPIEAEFRGHPIVGVLGEELLSDKLIWTFDRDRSMVYLAVQGHGSAPAGATQVKAAQLAGRIFVVKAKINSSADATVFIDHSAAQSAIDTRIARTAQLPSIEEARDHFGRTQRFLAAWKAETVGLGAAVADNMVLLPYENNADPEHAEQGRLGRDFLARFNVTVNLKEESMWLAPRAEDLAALTADRLARWQLSSWTPPQCAHPACLTFEITAATAGQPTAAPPNEGEEGEEGEPAAAASDAMIRIVRDQDGATATYDALIEPIDATGKRAAGAPRLLVTFPPGANEITIAGADMDRFGEVKDFRVLDMTPFPPKCEAATESHGCMWTLD